MTKFKDGVTPVVEFIAVRALPAPVTEVSISEQLNEDKILSSSDEMLTALGIPSGSTDEVIWSSYPAEKVNSSGVVLFTEVGELKVIAKAGNIADTIVYVVSRTIPVTINSSDTISVTVIPSSRIDSLDKKTIVTLIAEVDTISDNVDSTVTWSSSDNSKSTVNDRGLVTPVAVGFVVITAISNQDHNVKDDVVIEVKKRDIISYFPHLRTIETDIITWWMTFDDILHTNDGDISLGEGDVDFSVHPQDADGKNITYAWNDSNFVIKMYHHGVFIYYNRVDVNSVRIENSTIVFKLFGTVVYTKNIQFSQPLISYILPSDIKFDEMVLTFSGFDQNFREIEVQAILFDGIL